MISRVLTSFINIESTNHAQPIARAYLLKPKANVLNCQFEFSVKKIARNAPKNNGAKVLRACMMNP